MAEIVFSSGPLAGRKEELSESGLVFGRAADADIVIADLQVSGHHAELRLRDGAWTITDLDSSNGTELNGDPVQSSPLTDGDVVTLGDSQFTFGADDSPQVSEPIAEPTPVEEPADVAPAEPEEPAETKPEPGPLVEKAPPIKASREDVKLVSEMSTRTALIREEVGKVIVGQRQVIDHVLMCMLARGHALLIGLPGMAKTLMVSTIGKVLDLKFKRIQFTPDLMPSDITGTDVLETDRDTGEKEFRFIHGPIFCNLLLADEINRTPPKTQAALLEAMQEQRVTAGNTTYELEKPFFVLATQNPIEQEGTYPLPEAQLDRFMFNVWVDYPEAHEEEEIVGNTTAGGLAEPQCVLKQEEVLQLQEVVRKVPVSEHVVKYAIRLVRATRPVNEDSPDFIREYVSTGAGPRAGQYLVLAAKARAVLDGRIHVSCKDIREAAGPVLRHRILTNFAADSEGLTSMDIVTKLLDEIGEPGEEAYPDS